MASKLWLLWAAKVTIILLCQMYSDREAMKRQSTVLLTTAASDTRLTQALMEIEQLTKELETVKRESKEKVCVLDLKLHGYVVSSGAKRGLMVLPPNMSLSLPTMKHTGQELVIFKFWSKFWMKFSNFGRFAVKICKQCLQTASASGDFISRPPTGASLLDHTGRLPSPDPLCCSPQIKIPGATLYTVYLKQYKVYCECIIKLV